MAATPSIVVIGAGLVGLCTADRLLAGGAEVTVLEARSGPVRGASYSNSGMIHPSQFLSWDPDRPASAKAAAGAENRAEIRTGAAVLELARQSRDRLRARMEDLGLDEPLARPNGCYQLYPDVAAARAAQIRLAEAGLRANRVTDALRTLGRPALYFPEDRSADARQFGEALAGDLGGQGATLIYDAADVQLGVDGDPGEAGAVSVSLGAHRFRADHIVVAAGAQSPDLLRQVGLDAPIRPVRGWAVDFARPDGVTLPPLPIMDSASRSAFTPFPDRFRLSGTWGEDSARPLLARWAELMPVALARAGKPLSVWSGLRPVCAAARPLIGPAGRPGLWINAGHAHLGWTLCAGSGELMARMILDGWQDPRFGLPG